MSIKPEFEEMYKVVCSLLSRPESFVFREPVDWKGMGLTDYLDIVKTPMDLGTIKNKIENDKYETVEETARDIRLVWSNCMLYNRDGSEFYHLADKFSKSFEKAYAAMRKLQDSNADMDRIPSVEEKMELSYDIFKISNNELAKVLSMIETSSPNALSKKVSSDEVLINFDALNPRCFHEVNSFVMSCIIQSTNPKRGRKK